MLLQNSCSADTLRALETAPAIFLVLSPELYILTASDLFLQATESLREDIKGKYIFDAFPDNPNLPDPDGVNNIMASLQFVIKNKQAHIMPVQRYDVPDKSAPGKFIIRYWEPLHSPILDQNGSISYIIQSVRNVTSEFLSKEEALKSQEERRESLKQVDALHQDLFTAYDNLRNLNISLENEVLNRTKELQQSESKYRNLIEYSPIAMQVFRGEDMTFEIVNASMLRFLGKTADIIDKPLFVGVPEIVGQPIVEALYKVYRTGESLEIYAEKVILERNGLKEVGYYDVLYRALHNDGKITGVLGIAIEVTPQILAQQSIKESEARFRTMAEGSEILISLMNEKGKLEYLNTAWVNLTGWQQENLHDFNWEEYIHPSDLALVEKNIKNSLKAHEPFSNEFRLLNKQGEYRWLKIKGMPRLNSDQLFVGYICSGSDITREKQRLQEIENVNKALIRSNQQLRDTNIRLLESEENLLTAFNAGELGSCSLNLRNNVAEMSEQYRHHFGLPLKGEISWEMVLEAVEPEFLDEVKTVLENAAKYGSPVDSTYAIRHLVTGVRKWMRVVGKVYQGADGSNERIYAIVMDVTAQKEDEQRKNDFIAMVSHELKTPLTSVNGYVQLLQLKARNRDAFDINLFVDKIQTQLKKMTTMINGFLNISRLESGKIQLNRSRFDLSVLVSNLEEEYAAFVSTHRFICTPRSGMWVAADEDKIAHVINNLLSNAVKYSAFNSEIYISCKLIDEQVVLCVKDTGNGIQPQDIPKLFERYYRVQNEKTSTIAGFGIGLYLSAEIIERHGGKIWVESEVGIGSAFYFSIPYAPIADWMD
ncbi:PAS domain S-box protein [Pedobacter sp. MR22-3]|uniref:PAS domain-containing sensor histidine kinase n=1 Tax=Pedobacter sp. MR22-3 TaxID=2994552 RepID=UPI0022459A4F|nr:PAS domain S-box protein [Pedobacter sp. MR22-3]MCX2583806.1 PAS domain S-box protein [Pedobacter sp. MR22-3]